MGDFDKDSAQKRMDAMYGENKRITDENYDKSLSVTCINGTFVGKKADGTKHRCASLADAGHRPCFSILMRSTSMLLAD